MQATPEDTASSHASEATEITQATNQATHQVASQTKPASFYQYHVFVCLNQREAGEDCCAQRGAEAGFNYLKSQVKKLGLAGEGQVRVNRAGCLDRCQLGPVMVVYPQAVWYTFVDESDLDEIIDRHLKHGEIVERLLV